MDMKTFEEAAFFSAWGLAKEEFYTTLSSGSKHYYRLTGITFFSFEKYLYIRMYICTTYFTGHL